MVPSTRPSIVSPSSVSVRAIPKSVIFAPPSPLSSTFWGLTSRWTISLGMRRAERARDLDAVGERRGDLDRGLATDQVLERLAVDVLEHDVRSARLDPVHAARGARVPLAGVDHRDDVGMVELRHRARLATEALELIGVRGDLAVHQLDRDLALEHGVERAIHGAHATVPDARVEAVATAECGSEDGVVHVLGLERLSMPSAAGGECERSYFFGFRGVLAV